MSKYNFFVKYDLILFTNGGFYILQMCLAESGLSYPCHRLTVGRRSSPAQTREQSEEQSTDVHMVSDSDGDDFEDASEFGVDDGEVFGMASSALRKSPMSEY